MQIPELIETERLTLKPISLEYAEEINSGLDEDVTRYMFPKPVPLEETIEWVKSATEKNFLGTDYIIVILDKSTGQFVGGGGIHHIDTKTPEFGIWTKLSSHGNHYGREAVAALKKWADENLDYDYLLYPVDVDNIPSRKIAEFLDGVAEREYQDKDARGELMNLLEYRINKEGK